MILLYACATSGAGALVVQLAARAGGSLPNRAHVRGYTAACLQRIE